MRPSLTFLATFIVLAVCQTLATATPYWTEEELEAERQQARQEQSPRNIETGTRLPRTPLDEIAYFVKYRQLCDFLAGLQVTIQGQNFGGMREGEVGGDFSIIQTDNTQEAIRIWSQYAIWTGDTARYGQNIRNAWTYNINWPAWREEGGGYYAMHNCGWGFEAAFKFREAYGDTSMNWYADSCAWWVMNNPLSLNSTVNVAAQGLGIGGMYAHAVYRNRNDWRDHTFARARLIRNWFEANPSRLNNATEWALCGGTALWGVCNSLWVAYPDSGELWIDQYGTQLETWEAPSSWYHAYNTWYSNATFRCWEITGDSLYWNRGVFYADSLLAFDVDDDGGIPPGTCCISNGNDHSWVSAYMGWMGLERIISAGPIVLAEVQAQATPDPGLPLLEGDNTTLHAHIANLGTDSIECYVTADDNGNYSSVSQGFILPPGEEVTVSFPNTWQLPLVEDIALPLRVQFSLRYWAMTANPDTFEHGREISFDLRRRTNVFGTITGPLDQSTVPVHIDFYAAEYPDSIWTSVDIAAGEQYSNGNRPLLEGNNRMVITTPLRYLTETRDFVTLHDNTDPFDIWLTASDVVLIDDDSGEDYETFITSSLEENDEAVRLWDRQTSAVGDLSSVPWLIWMTGDDSENTLTSTDQQTIVNYLQTGGGVLVTGQNITDDDNTAQFLHDVFYCTQDREDTDRLRAFGLGDDPDVDGQFLLLLGSQGAANQTSPSSITPLDNATAIFINDTLTEEVCGISGVHGTGKFIFLSFGLEAASGQAGSTSRAQFLAEAKEWLTETVDANEGPRQVPHDFSLLPAYPNPFNGSVRISWIAPAGQTKTTVAVFDLLGRQVSTLFDGESRTGTNLVTWAGQNASGIPVASGTYIVRLTTPAAKLSQTVRYIR